MSRFSQAISEGDGISVIPALEGDVAELAAAAEAAGAEAIAVARLADAAAARGAVALPVLVREPVRSRDDVERLHAAGADALVLVYAEDADESGLLADLQAEALELDLDCALDVRDDEELERALERVDPDIVFISRQDDGGGDRDELERVLDLLPDVPAGKLVVAESGVIERDQALALERAGIDAVLVVADLVRAPDFAARVAELTGR
jgi:indole-3-glycerol phosphate synthase